MIGFSENNGEKMQRELTKTEVKAIQALKKLEKKWPKTLWLFSASGTLCVMAKNDYGNRAITNDGGCDQDFIVDEIKIENDGGDW